MDKHIYVYKYEVYTYTYNSVKKVGKNRNVEIQLNPQFNFNQTFIPLKVGQGEGKITDQIYAIADHRISAVLPIFCKSDWHMLNPL